MLKTIGDLTDEQILDWANHRVSEDHRVGNFKDAKLKTSHFYFHVMKSIEHRAIDWHLVLPGDNS